MSKFETNSNDRNINDQNRIRQYLVAFVLNFEDSDFDIVSDFDIRILQLGWGRYESKAFTV